MRLRLAVLLSLMLPGIAVAAPAYRPVASIALGAPDRWDYVVVDPSSGRVYVAHGDRLSVVDGRAGRLIGEVTGIAGGTHGTAIVGPFGVTDDGRSGQAVVFDLATLAVVRRVPAGADADAVASDPATGHALVVSGDPGTVAIIDPARGTRLAVIPTGEELEYAAPGAAGRVYVAGKAKGDVVVIDTRTATVAAHWPMPDCAKPHGLAVDTAAHRLFMGCANSRMMVVDTDNGHVVTTLAIGRGSDAVAFDPTRHRVFSSNGGDGSITVYRQETPDRYVALEPVATKAGGRTMAVDPRTGRLFVIAADMIADGTPRGHARPGSAALLMYDPVD